MFFSFTSIWFILGHGHHWQGLQLLPDCSWETDSELLLPSEDSASAVLLTRKFQDLDSVMRKDWNISKSGWGTTWNAVPFADTVVHTAASVIEGINGLYVDGWWGAKWTGCLSSNMVRALWELSTREEYSIKHLSSARRWGKALGCQGVSQTSWVVASLIIIWSHWTLNHYCLFSEVLHLIAHLETGLDFTSDCTWRRVKRGWMDMGLTVYNRSEVKLTSFISCASMQKPVPMNGKIIIIFWLLSRSNGRGTSMRFPVGVLCKAASL